MRTNKMKRIPNPPTFTANLRSGLDAQHAAAQMMQAAASSPGTLAEAQARMNEARSHYDHVLSMQSDHAAAFFCRAGISLQDAQILKRSASYNRIRLKMWPRLIRSPRAPGLMTLLTITA